MTMGWRNLKQREDQERQMTKHYRERGYSDGYAGLVAKSLQVDYQRGWKAGRQARREFDASP